VQVIVTDREAFPPFRAYLELIAAARAQRPDAFDWRREPYEFERTRLAIDLLLGRADLRPALEAGTPPAGLEAAWAEPLREFETRRAGVLLYA